VITDKTGTILFVENSDYCFTLEQGFPTFLLPCTPSAFRQMSMYPFSISTDKYVRLQHSTDTHVPLKFPMLITFYHSYS